MGQALSLRITDKVTSNISAVLCVRPPVESTIELFMVFACILPLPPELHDSPEDDDRSAITFWIPWTRKDGHNFEVVRDIFGGLIRNLDQALNNMENSQ